MYIRFEVRCKDLKARYGRVQISDLHALYDAEHQQRFEECERPGCPLPPHVLLDLQKQRDANRKNRIVRALDADTLVLYDRVG